MPHVFQAATGLPQASDASPKILEFISNHTKWGLIEFYDG